MQQPYSLFIGFFYFWHMPKVHATVILLTTRYDELFHTRGTNYLCRLVQQNILTYFLIYCLWTFGSFFIHPDCHFTQPLPKKAHYLNFPSFRHFIKIEWKEINLTLSFLLLASSRSLRIRLIVLIFLQLFILSLAFSLCRTVMKLKF
jgi:hypothetical protein